MSPPIPLAIRDPLLVTNHSLDRSAILMSTQYISAEQTYATGSTHCFTLMDEALVDDLTKNLETAERAGAAGGFLAGAALYCKGGNNSGV